MTRALGLSFKPKKTVRPTTRLEFLGLELDSEAMEVRLPTTKLDYLREVLLDWEMQSHCSLKELQEIIGYLQFCAQGVPHGRTFIRGLMNFSMKFPSEFTLRHMPVYVCMET